VTFARACLSIFHSPRTRKVPSMCCPIGKVQQLSMAFPLPGFASASRTLRSNVTLLASQRHHLIALPSGHPGSHQAHQNKRESTLLIVPGAENRTIKVSGFRILESLSMLDQNDKTVPCESRCRTLYLIYSSVHNYHSLHSPSSLLADSTIELGRRSTSQIVSALFLGRTESEIEFRYSRIRSTRSSWFRSGRWHGEEIGPVNISRVALASCPLLPPLWDDRRLATHPNPALALPAVLPLVPAAPAPAPATLSFDAAPAATFFTAPAPASTFSL
jgi:hypothetical protein